MQTRERKGYVIIRFERRLHSTRDFVSAVSLWHKRTVKKSYKKFTFTRCLRIATALANAHNYLLGLAHVFDRVARAGLAWERAQTDVQPFCVQQTDYPPHRKQDQTDAQPNQRCSHSDRQTICHTSRKLKQMPVTRTDRLDDMEEADAQPTQPLH